MLSKKELHSNEVDKDFATSFVATKFVSGGYASHCHRNIELYGVVNGEVMVTVAGERKLLHSGQIVVTNCLEIHDFTMLNDDAEVFSLTIGTLYFVNFVSIYKNKLLPRWLLDVEYNKKLYQQIEPWFGYKGKVSELKKFAVSNSLFADIVEHYGVRDGGNDEKSHEFMERVIQYIYEHYAEDISLVKLAEIFSVDQYVLSKKISQYTGKDLRRFVNDVRAVKARQMMEDPRMRDVPKKEIAQLCGFKALETFYRVYKRNFIFDFPADGAK